VNDIGPMGTFRADRGPVPVQAIVIVDVQKAFPVPPEILRRIEARARDFPLRVFTRFINPPGSLLRCKLDRQSCAPGSDDTQLLLRPGADDLVLEKPGYGLNHQQLAQLFERGLKRVLVCGVDTDACVLGTVFTLFDAGIDCEVEPDLCWSSMGLHEVALKILRAQFGTALAPAARATATPIGRNHAAGGGSGR
jgi:nicotinamidase-related amidase